MVKNIGICSNNLNIFYMVSILRPASLFGLKVASILTPFDKTKGIGNSVFAIVLNG
ncbi:MAG TPA: hypothetical protein VJR94_04855 [Candidatus Nitrosocosmicus sp.]|nr:hypothetical protein [Candidatus Nitrosocosmicus sp.]